jgi:hypothetical protein
MTESSIFNFFNRTIVDLKNNADRLGLTYTGKYKNELEYKNDKSGLTEKHQIWGATHTQYIVNGRGSNKIQSVDAAKKLYPIALEWARTKGPSVDNVKQFAFRVALKWVYKGIQVPNQYNPGTVVEDVINERWFRNGIDQVGGALLAAINSDILKSIKRM